MEQLLLHVPSTWMCRQRPSQGCASLCCARGQRGCCARLRARGWGLSRGCLAAKALCFPCREEGGVEGRKARVYVSGSGNCNFPFEFH